MKSHSIYRAIAFAALAAAAFSQKVPVILRKQDFHLYSPGFMVAEFSSDVTTTVMMLVIMHDNRLNRTTDGTGIVEETTLDEIRRCRLQACSEPVPTLEEVLEVFAGRDDIFVELEMKAYPSKFYTPDVLAEDCRDLESAGTP